VGIPRERIGSDEDGNLEEKKSKGSIIIVEDDDLMRKVVEQEKAKTSEMSRMQKEVGKRQFHDKVIQDEHYYQIKDELNQMINENEGLKETTRNLQRKEKEHLQTIKELREELERKKEKNYFHEFNKMESQSLMDEKEKLVKELQGQLKQREDEIENLKINLNTQHKRIELKETSLKDHLNKLNDKYVQS
jgi:DNA repair exonuclease SbcCD ATPase subunit